MPSSPSALLARTRAIPPRALDAGLGLVVLAGTAIEAAFADAPTGARVLALLPAAVVAAALLLRRREPIAALALSGLGPAGAACLDHAVWQQLNVLYFGFLLLVYSVGVREAARRLRLGLLVAVLALAANSVVEVLRQDQHGLIGDLVTSAILFVAAPVFAGRLSRSRLLLNDALREKAASSEANREDAAAEAVAAERVRIASELHDLVAHALGAMTIQASAARRLAVKDTARAAGAFEAVEQTGRSALGELRTLLAVLGDEDGGGPVPQPGLDDLPGLAARAEAAGLGVEVTVEGARPDGLAAGVDLTGYRVVQDALRAAREQGGANSARVRLRYRGDRLEIEVVDDGHRVAGRRLLGLRERVRLFGGEVSVDGRGTGGHCVRARLPTGAAA